MTGFAALAVAAGIALVRLGWGGRPLLATLGWLLAGAVLAFLVAMAGAWGLAVGTVAGMVAALAALAWSGWTVPGRARRLERERIAAALVREPLALALARRASVFVLVVPVGGGAALWLAFAAQAMVRRAGMDAADASACLLFALPLLWCSLMAWQMTRDGPRRMVLAPLLAAGLGTLLWVAR